jgi:hypothetical protein
MNAWASSTSTIFEAAMGWNGVAAGYYPVFTIDGLGKTTWTDNAGNVRATIDSSGRLGIGTASPSSLLHLASNAPYITLEDIDNNQDWQIQATAWFAIRDQTANAERMRIDSSGNVSIPSGNLDVTGNIDLPDNNKLLLGNSDDLEIYHDGNSWIRDVGTGNLYIDSGSSIYLYANGNTPMLYAQPGAGVTSYYNGVGKFATTSSGAEVLGNLDVTNALNVGGASPVNTGFIESTVVGASRALQTVGGVGTTQTHVGFENIYGEIGRIDVSAFSVSYVTSSDYRLKTDIHPMQDSIDRVKALKPVNFEWKEEGTRVDGFLAHEVQEVVPEAISGEKDATKTNKDGVEVPDYQGIDQSKLVPLLTSALQEALAKIDDLELRMANLEN